MGFATTTVDVTRMRNLKAVKRKKSKKIKSNVRAAVVENNCFILVQDGQMYFFGQSEHHIQMLYHMLGIQPQLMGLDLS